MQANIAPLPYVPTSCVCVCMRVCVYASPREFRFDGYRATRFFVFLVPFFVPGRINPLSLLPFERRCSPEGRLKE